MRNRFRLAKRSMPLKCGRFTPTRFMSVAVAWEYFIEYILGINRGEANPDVLGQAFVAVDKTAK